MDQVESKFLQTQKFQPLVWFRYIDIFFIWTHDENSLKNFKMKFNNLKFNNLMSSLLMSLVKQVSIS